MAPTPIRRRVLLAGGALSLAATPRAHAADAQVVIDDYEYKPAELRIAPGTTVTWENHDSDPHNVVSNANPRVFRSRTMATGEKFSFTFAEPGTYRYYCSLHPHMQAVVVVA